MALTPGWDVAVFRLMVNVKQPKNKSFAKWMNGIRGANFSLSDTRFHKDAAALQSHLESLISDDLVDYLSSMTKAERDRVEAIEDFEDWLREMMEIDDKMSKTHKCNLELIEEAVKRQAHPSRHTAPCPCAKALRWPPLPVLPEARSRLGSPNSRPYSGPRWTYRLVITSLQSCPKKSTNCCA